MLYKDAGVNIEKTDLLKEKINKFLPKGARERFSGIYPLRNKEFLAATIDGLGTKFKIAKMMDRYSSIGEDIVNHCTNDLLCSWAKPLFFLDFVASSSIEPKIILEILKGMKKALRRIKCPLIGGETAEMPGVYIDGECEIVGVMIGKVVKNPSFKKNLKKGDLIFGIPSSGLHTNGFSLARKILFEKEKTSPYTFLSEYKKNLGDVLLTVHRNYFPLLFPIIKKRWITALVHITGGGFKGNLKRVLPNNLDAILNFREFNIPKIFKLIQEKGDVPLQEMFNVFNMGIGMIVIVSPRGAKPIQEYFKKKKEKLYFLGTLEKGKGDIQILTRT